MTLDLSTVTALAIEHFGESDNPCNNGDNPNIYRAYPEEVVAFAQACYAMGAAEQKEKDIKICESEWNGDSDTLIYSEACNDCAEAIRSQE